MKSSTTLNSFLLLLFWYVLQLFIFSHSFILSLHSCTQWHLKWNTFSTRYTSSQSSLTSFFLSCIFESLTMSSFKSQPTIQKHEELVLLVGNLKLEVTEYSRSLYGLEGTTYPGNYDDDDDDDGDEDSEVTPSYQPRKRRFH